MNYHDFIWDLGGTLIDNYAQSARAFQLALKGFGVNAKIEDIYHFLKKSTAHAIQHYIPDNEAFYQHYKKLEKEALEQPLFCIGAEELLRETHQKGCRHFLISNRDNQTLNILEKLGVKELFTEVVTSDSGFPRKPAPDSMIYLKEKYQLDNALVLGDREIDREAGEATGFDVYLIKEKKGLLELVEGERNNG